ncbi:MAG TPA: hypothetical protein VGJ44_26915 [Kribbellaceae bacterium]
MAAGIKVDVDAFWRDGYQVIPGVYTPDEIKKFREGALASRSHGGDLLSNPHMKHALTDGKMAEVAKQILGSDEVWYAGDSSFTINSNQHGYHKDNADRTDPNAPDWQGRYTILRFGIYLQDHTKHTGGLNLRHASHNTVSLTEGKHTYIRNRVGDLAVWSLRTTHSGNGTLLKWPRWVSPEVPVKPEEFPWYYRVAKAEGDRMAVFAAIGLDDAHHDRYTEYLKTRTYICNIWRKSPYDDETIAEAERNGLRIRNVPKEIEGDDTVGQNEKWQAIPY